MNTIARIGATKLRLKSSSKCLAAAGYHSSGASTLRPSRMSSESRSEKKCLDIKFTLPDWSNLEEAFVKQQTRIHLEPDYLIEAQDIAKRNRQDHIWDDPAALRHLYPSKEEAKELCKRQIKKVFPDFQAPNYFYQLLKSVGRTQHLAEALHLCNINPESLRRLDFCCEPLPFVKSIILSQMARRLNITKDNRRQKPEGLCTDDVDDHIRHITDSLTFLGLEEEAGEIEHFQNRTFFTKNISLQELWDKLGLMVLQSIARRKNIHDDVSSFLHSSLQWSSLNWTRKSPIDIARNFYLSEQIYQPKVGTPGMKKHYELNRYVLKDPLESLISLNTLQGNMSLLDPNLEDKAAFIHFLSDSGVFRDFFGSKAVNVPEMTVRRLALKAIGFQDSEILTIFTKFRGSNKFHGPSPGSPAVLFDSPDIVALLRPRLELIRADGVRLGLVKANEIWQGVKDWHSLLQQTSELYEAKASEIGLSPVVRKTSPISITQRISRASVQHLNSTKLLSLVFGLDVMTSLDPVLKPNSWFRDVPASRIQQTLNLLNKKGFTNDHIKNSLHLLFFPSNLVEQKLKEIQGVHRDEFSGPNGNKIILAFCLYYIEKEFNFAADGLLSAGSSVIQPSTKFLEEIQKYSTSKSHSSKDKLSKVHTHHNKCDHSWASSSGSSSFEGSSSGPGPSRRTVRVARHFALSDYV